MASKKGIGIAVFGGKGGIGKTITTLNLAGAYELLQKKTLIIDLDLFGGGIATALNLDFEKNIYNCIDDIMNNRYHNWWLY